MKKLSLIISFYFFICTSYAQTVLHGDYKIIDIGGNGYGDFTRSLILLHEIYNGADIDRNYAIGTITAMRGTHYTLGRLNIVQLNTLSAYRKVVGSLTAFDDDEYQDGTVWKLKTCFYSGKKYLAVEVPFGYSYHDWGFKFNGATSSTGESMKCVSFEVSGQPVNQNLIGDIQNFQPGMIETHAVANLNITGKLGIGVRNSSSDMLAVKGTIHSQEVKVDMNGWADYVLQKDYDLKPLSEVKAYINEHQHLPEVPSEKEVVEKGLLVGEMNKILMKKVEELTLYLIEKDRIENDQNKKILSQQQQIDKLSKRFDGINSKRVPKNKT